MADARSGRARSRSGSAARSAACSRRPSSSARGRSRSGPGSCASVSPSKMSATYPIALRDADLRAVGRGDAGALLPAVLQRVEPEVGHVGRFGMAEDAEDAALVLEFVQHVSGHSSGEVRDSIAVDQTRSASSTDTIDRRSSPATAIRSRLPPVWPMTRAGTPAAAACRSTAVDVARATTDTTTREADSPNSAAAIVDARGRATLDRFDRRLRRRCRRCRSSIRRASPPGRRPSSRAPSGSAARRRASTSSACSARSASRSSAGGTPRTRSCTTFRYSLPPSSPRPSPSSTIDVAGLLEPPRQHAVGMLEQADDADDRRRIDRACRRSRCRG